MRKKISSWNELKIGDKLLFIVDEFDGILVRKHPCEVVSVENDHAIALEDDGSNLWIDNDTLHLFERDTNKADVDYKKLMQNLAYYNMEFERLNKRMDEIKDQLKNYMVAKNIDTLLSDEHKATYKEVASSRIDTSALRAEFPLIVAMFEKEQKTMRFNFS